MDFAKYESKLTWPGRPEKPVIGRNPTIEEAEKYVNDLKGYERLKTDYDMKCEEYRREESDLLTQFRQDLVEELGISDAPWKERLLAKAWEDGHSSGLENVFYYAQELVDMING